MVIAGVAGEPERSDGDIAVRCYVYDVALGSGRVPSVEECARALRRPVADISNALRRLDAAHQIVLSNDGELLMAMPFSAIPTAFEVRSGELRAFANCGWDALGIAAMLQRDARISTSCADCGDPLEIDVRGSQATAGAALLHFALPVRRWWESVVFT